MKSGRQIVKDYVAYPALTSVSPLGDVRLDGGCECGGERDPQPLTNAVIFCATSRWRREVHHHGHGGESRGQWYLRQMLGSANIDAGPTLGFLTGNLSHQIEHHLYPDLPSSRLAEIRSGCGSATNTTCPIPAGRSGAVRQVLADHRETRFAATVPA